jgi:hypothetical protein
MRETRKVAAERGGEFSLRMMRFLLCAPILFFPGFSCMLPQAPFSILFNGGLANRTSLPVRIIADARGRKGYIRILSPGESTSQRLEDVDFVENPLSRAWMKINPLLVPPSGYLVLTEDLIRRDWPALDERSGLSYVAHVLAARQSGSE